MKAKLFISIAWVVGMFLLLTSMLYAVNDYDKRMMLAVTGKPGVQPSLDNVSALDQQRLKAKTLDEFITIQDRWLEESERFLSTRSAAFSQRRLIQRAWLLWGVSAFVPLLFIWWPHLSGLLRGIQEAPRIHDETHAA